MYVSWDMCNYIIYATILDFWFPVSSDSVTDCTIEKFDPENMRLSVEMFSLASQEAEIHLGGSSFTPAPSTQTSVKITFNIWGLKRTVLYFSSKTDSRHIQLYKGPIHS